MRDVRMRGFAQRADVSEVDRFLSESVKSLGTEEVSLLDCASRVLAVDVRAEVSIPPFERAAMDGYAVRGEDTFGASEYNPIELRLIGETLPGERFKGTLAPGEAVRIMTGAPVPTGADAVVMAEVCAESEERVELQAAVAPRKNVGAVGEDICAGDVVLRAGRVLRAQDVGLLASIGAASIPCVRRPRVRLLMTGDELLPPGSRPEGAKIVDSNSVMLCALVERDSGEIASCEILPDRPELIRAALERSDCEVVLLSGGSSVGREDHAPRLVAELGSLDFHGVAMRPSSPSGIGRIGARWVFLLPGNPVSCLCAYDFFAGPTVRTLGGRSREWPHRRITLPLARKISSMVGRVDYVRVAIREGRVVPISTAGASILSSTVRAAGFVIVPREREGIPEGGTTEVLLYDDVPPEVSSS